MSSSRPGAGRPCGRNESRQRVGWNDIAAVRNGQIYEIKSAYILQPGPAALTEGLQQLHGILSEVRASATAATTGC